MQWFLYLIGAVWIMYGCSAILYTTEIRQMLQKVLSLNPKLLAVGVAVVGLLMILSGSASSHAWFIRLLGLLAVGKGAFIYFNPAQKWTQVSVAYVETFSDQAHRMTGIIALIFGTALFSWIH